MTNLTEFKNDLETLKAQRARVQVKLEEAVNRAKSLKDTLKTYGYDNLTDAKAAYAQILKDVESKHLLVKEYINKIKTAEAEIPTRDMILDQLRKELQLGTVEVSTEDSTELKSVSTTNPDFNFVDDSLLDSIAGI